ncbi:MAG: NAD(P)/FAD-dependent oxidoreductase, partial [archaeon]|nr:NAD(P)/FAD-dependent oxidoreductase [archaeon]
THPICFGLLNTTVSDNIMLLGDAALQVKPFSGGGIIYSFICADIAAKVISDALIENSFTAKVLAEYDRRWKSHLAEKIKIGLGIRQTLNNLSDTELDTFFSLMSHNRKSIENFGDMDFL